MKIFQKKHKKSQEKEPVAPPADTPETDDFFRDVDIAFLVHELKDPIAVIETGVRTLLERQDKYGELTGKQERTLQRTLRNSRKARGLLNHLLEIGRSQAGCFDACRFQPAQAAHQALSDALETAAYRVFEKFCHYEAPAEAMDYLAGCGISLNIDASCDALTLVQDKTKFCQIVGNLIKNALHHRDQRVEIRVGQEHERLFVDVTDDGPGIDPEHHQLIFQRYTRLKACTLTLRDGHGLGLAGARIMARRMGGDIEIQSQKGKGTTFRLVLPLTPAV